jgi:hypothetical protein
MKPGLHTVAVSAVDGFGHESARSELLTVVVTTSGASASLGSPAADAHAQAASPAASRAAAVPTRACAAQNCYVVSVLARGEGSVSRLEAVADDGVLMLRDGSEVLLLRSGATAIAYQLRRDDPRASAIADIAVDPDFVHNRFVYLAVLTASSASTHVRVVRTREVGDTLAEAATIVPDLPVANGVTPRLTITPDRHIYVAIPASTDGSAGQPYDGLILAFTDEGRAAGSAVASPAFARGPEQPGTLEVGAAGQVWIAATDAAVDGVQLLRFTADGAFATTRAMENASANSERGVLDLAFTRSDRGVLITASPQALYEFRLSPDAAALVSARIDLGGFEPTAVTTLPSGDIVVAARNAANPDAVAVLSLRIGSDVAR